MPYFMSIGMSYDDYWIKDAYLTQIYYKLHDLRNQAKNEELWLQGAYFFQALQSALANVFKKKGQQASNYLKEPFDINPKCVDTEEEKKQERTKVVNFFNSLKDSWDEKHG